MGDVMFKKYACIVKQIGYAHVYQIKDANKNRMPPAEMKFIMFIASQLSIDLAVIQTNGKYACQEQVAVEAPSLVFPPCFGF